MVQLIYGRYPDIAANLPVYPNAEGVELRTVRHDKEPADDGRVVRIITKTYTTKASPADVETYYTSTMEQYGWMYFERGKGIMADEGIYFAARRFGSTPETTVGIALFVTATIEQDGQTIVALRVVETERPIDL
jgi:hypothetical protein